MARMIRVDACLDCPMGALRWDTSLGVSEPMGVDCTEWARGHSRYVTMDIARQSTPDWCPLSEAEELSDGDG
jgi:hypothetical protein